MSDKDLIAEARRHAEALIRGDEIGDADLLHAMASALEARQVDEADVADEIQRHRHVMVAPGPHECSCGEVLDGWARAHKLHVARAVMEFLGERHEPEPCRPITNVPGNAPYCPTHQPYTGEWPCERQERIEAEARIAEAAKLHRSIRRAIGNETSVICVHDETRWPCETAVALGLNEGEVAEE